MSRHVVAWFPFRTSDIEHRHESARGGRPAMRSSQARAMVACGKCLGAGVTPAKPSRRQLHEHRAAAAAAQGPIARPVLRRVPCTACAGVGLQPGPAAPPLHAGAPAPTVAIVGGGIGGAALALALQQRGVAVRVFERDRCFAERAQVLPVSQSLPHS